jgi:hypothetical protein
MPLNRRSMGVTGDDHLDASARIDVQRLQIVQNIDRFFREAHEFRVSEFAAHSPVSTFPRIAVTGAILRSASTIFCRPMSPACTI